MNRLTEQDRQAARRVRTAAERQAARQRRADQAAARGAALELLAAAERYARLAARRLPGTDVDALVSDLVERGLTGQAPTLATALTLADDRRKAALSEQATVTALTGGTARQASRRRRRLSRLARRAYARQVGRLVISDACHTHLVAPTAGVGADLVAALAAPDARRQVTDLVRHQAVLPGAADESAMKARPRRRHRDVLALRGLAVLFGIPVPPADLSVLTDQAGALSPAVTSPGARLAALVAAVLSDGRAAPVDVDTAAWWHQATGQAARLAGAGAERTLAVPRFPDRAALGRAPLATDVARHQVGHQATLSPVRLVREAPLAAMLDRRRLSADTFTRDADLSAAPLSGGLAGAVAAMRWDALVAWQAPTDARGARGDVARAVARADRASQVLTALANLSVLFGGAPDPDALVYAPVTVGRLAAAHVNRQGNLNLSAACRAVGIAATATNRAALAALVDQAARAARLAADRPYRAGDARGARRRTLATPDRPTLVGGARLAGRAGRVARLRDPGHLPARTSPADVARLAALVAATDQAPDARQGGAWSPGAPALPTLPAWSGDAPTPGLVPACRCLVCLARAHQGGA